MTGRIVANGITSAISPLPWLKPDITVVRRQEQVARSDLPPTG